MKPVEVGLHGDWAHVSKVEHYKTDDEQDDADDADDEQVLTKCLNESMKYVSSYPLYPTGAPHQSI